MFKRTLTVLALLSLIATIPFVGNSVAAPPPELREMRQVFTGKWQGATNSARRRELLNDYIKNLTSLEYYMRGNGRDRTSINAVRKELRRANDAVLGEGEIASDAATRATGAVSSPEPAAVVDPVTAPAAAIKKHIPRTIVINHRGTAGTPDFSKGNIYNFTLTATSKKGTLIYWAGGRNSTDTYGEIWLTSPDGRRRKIAKWKKSFFREATRDVSTWSRLRPVTVDISDYLKAPGAYSLEFHWTDGVDPLIIMRVEIIS